MRHRRRLLLSSILLALSTALLVVTGTALAAPDSAQAPGTPGGGRATELVTDGAGYCALLSSGRAACWGANRSGEGLPGVLGDGTETSSHIPVTVQGLVDAASLVGSPNGYCALLVTGRVECWGDNGSSFNAGSGDLGDGSAKAFSDVPVSVKGLTGATRLATDGDGYCALLSSGKVSCWGDNTISGAGADGALGNGSTEAFSDVPVTVKGLTDATSVVSGGSGSYCALLASGEVSCWGEDSVLGGGTDGALGNGRNERDSDVPVAVKGLTGAVSLASGGSNTLPGYCAVLRTGAAECWGDTSLGAPFIDGGSGGVTDVPLPVRGLTGAVGIVSDEDGYCAVLGSGEVECWGDNRSSSLGEGGAGTYSTVPVMVRGLRTVRSLVGGYDSYCAVLTSGAATCWGEDPGSLGNGSSTGTYSKVPVEVKGLVGVVRLASDGQGFCAVLDDGGVDCWGANNFGELGNGGSGSGKDADSRVPLPVLGLGV